LEGREKVVDRFHETNISEGMEFNPTDLILRSRAQHGVSKDGRLSTFSLVAVLRDARKSALLRTRSNGDIDMIQTSEMIH
jgi:hypothetical protein